LTNPLQERQQRLTGIALMCGAVLCFACLDTTAKFLTHHMDALQVVWARFTSAFLLVIALWNPVRRPGLMRTSRPVLQIARSVLMFASSLLNFVALQFLQLDEALAIIFSTPFLVAAFAGPILGEWIRWRRWCAIGVGFVGVLVVTRPGVGGIHPAALLSLTSAVCLAFYAITTRMLARTDSNETTMFYSNVVGTVALLPVLPFIWSAPASWPIVLLMLAMGVFGTIGHFMLIAGHRLAPATVLAPFVYTQLVWVIALGFFVFGDVPNRWTLAGSAIVIASGLYLLYRERHVRGQL
jgi:drug/metabolite transporter (DMT)-like permease